MQASFDCYRGLDARRPQMRRKPVFENGDKVGDEIVHREVQGAGAGEDLHRAVGLRDDLLRDAGDLEQGD